MSKFSRRSFLGGSAAVAGGLVVADHLRFLEPSTGELASADEFLTGKEVVYRTGTRTTATVPAGTSCTSSTAG